MTSLLEPSDLQGFEQEAEKEGITFTTFDKFVSFCFRLFSRPATSISARMPKLRTNLLRSNMRSTPEGLIAVALFISLVSGIVCIPIVLIGWYVVGGLIGRLLLLVVLAVPLEFFLIIAMPGFSATSRSAAIENELPFVLGYMSVLSGGGVSPMATMRRISNMSLLPASSKEAKRIILETDVFGQDPITAMETASKATPNRHYSEFLAGYTAILKTGGNIESYVTTKLRDMVSNKASSIKRSADITGTFAEAYLTVTVVLGMTLYTLDMIEVLLSHNSSGLVQLYFFAFIVVPLVSAAFLFLADSTAPKWPYTDWRPYKHLYYSLPAGLVFEFIPIALLPLYIHTAIALAIVGVPPAIFAFRYSSERRALERALPDFIRDVAEGRKTGLSPEMAIERLTTRPYGPLSKHVEKMGSQLSWGIDLSKVIDSFTENVASWITRIIGTLLVEVVDVGGGTVRSFAEMADFSRTISDMENDRRSSLRPFLAITYIAGVMVIVTTFIMIYLLVNPATAKFSSTSSLNSTTIDNLLTTAVFDTFIIGLVAGKMGEGGVSDGFKHAVALVVISVVAVAIAKLFIHIPVA